MGAYDRRSEWMRTDRHDEEALEDVGVMNWKMLVHTRDLISS